MSCNVYCEYHSLFDAQTVRLQLQEISHVTCSLSWLNQCSCLRSAMGRSRSVSVVLAYLLATRPQTCPDVSTALALVCETRPFAQPNPGFMKQLELYKAMGCPIDIDSHPMYQRWLYQQEVQMSLAIGRAPDRLRFEDEEAGSIEEPKTSASSGDSEKAKESGKELRCKKCRRTLATDLYLIPHTPRSKSPATIQPDPTANRGPISSLPSSAVQPQPCTHHFIHPLSWMRSTLSDGRLDGRLECPNPKCGQQVGRYAWQGLKCSCGHWVTPGFSLAGGKVDEVLSRPSGVGARLPPGMREEPSVREKGSL
jgi:dual specificity phosphatase 12